MTTLAPQLGSTSPIGLDSTDGAVIGLPISDAYPDAYSIIAHIQELSVQFGRLPIVRAYAAVILPAHIGDNDVPAQIWAMTEFVKSSVKYVMDPEGTEFVISPLVMLKQIFERGETIGDCDDHVMLLNSLLRSLGIATRTVGVKLNARDRFDHVISSAYDGDQWIDIDLCAKGVSVPFYSERLVAQ